MSHYTNIYMQQYNNWLKYFSSFEKSDRLWVKLGDTFKETIRTGSEKMFVRNPALTVTINFKLLKDLKNRFVSRNWQ